MTRTTALELYKQRMRNITVSLPHHEHFPGQHLWKDAFVHQGIVCAYLSCGELRLAPEEPVDVLELADYPVRKWSADVTVYFGRSYTVEVEARTEMEARNVVDKVVQSDAFHSMKYYSESALTDDCEVNSIAAIDEAPVKKGRKKKGT